MKKNEPPDPASSSRFFHAMVIMGGSVAVGCGGVTTSGKLRDSDGTDASANGGSSSIIGPIVSATGGASNSFGGRHVGGPSLAGSGAGGATNSGGVTLFLDGGGSCVPQQRECNSGAKAECSNYGNGVSPPSGCPCNADRPTRAADCAPGQLFVCRLASSGITAGAEQVVHEFPFECSCVTASDPSSCGACEQAFGPVPSGTYDCSLAPQNGGLADVLCGCAVIYLL
jgi:hypothetical protein